MEMDTLSFSIAPVAVLVEIDGEPYVLREASEAAHANHQNAMMARVKVGDNFRPDLTNAIGTVANADAVLLANCLFKVTAAVEGSQADEIETPVDVATIRSWPRRVTKPLIAKAKEISETDADTSIESLKKQRNLLSDRIAKLEAGEDPAKNAPSDTTAGSG